MNSSEPSKDLGAAGRCFGVFTDPVGTFNAIVRKPDFWPPLIILILIWIALSELMAGKIGIETIVRRSLELSGRASGMTPEQMQKAVEQGAKVGSIFLHFSFLNIPIFLIIIAAIGMLILKAVFGTPIGFKKAFSVAVYADLPYVIAGILGIFVISFGDPAGFNPQNFIPANVGFFLSPENISRPLYSIATALNVFSFWLMGLLGIGFAAAAGRKMRPRSVFFCFLGLWVIWVLVRAGLAAI